MKYAYIRNKPGLDHFSEEPNADGELRWAREETALVYVQGDAGGSGRSNTQSSFSVCFGPRLRRHVRLREKADGYDQSTFRRAELEAAIAAAKHPWRSEGYSKVVIATDSEYLFKGINLWILKWQENGWLTSRKTPVKHQDLWQRLWQLLENNNTAVEFYQISRDQNKAAAWAERGMVSTPSPKASD